MKDSEFEADGILFSADAIGYEYQQLDGDNAGRSDDGTMYRDVIGLTNKVSYDFSDFRDEQEISNILKLLEKTECSLKYYDLKEMNFITKRMYVVGDAIKLKKIGEERTVEPFQIRFIQMNTDNVG